VKKWIRQFLGIEELILQIRWLKEFVYDRTSRPSHWLSPWPNRGERPLYLRWRKPVKLKTIPEARFTKAPYLLLHLSDEEALDKLFKKVKKGKTLTKKDKMLSDDADQSYVRPARSTRYL
jgi:hypothetical protein